MSDEQMARQRLGEVLHGWKLEALLGVGGMAAVYAATGPDGRKGAVKVLHPEMSRREDVRERFFREGQAANLVGHPGVVRILENGLADENTAILVMELLDGESLSDVIKRQQGLNDAQLLDVLDQVLDVLIAAHEKQIIHRDLKPDNLFLLPDGQVKVLDFGIARLSDRIPAQHKTRTGIALGTVPYMAPEQALAKRGEIDARSDLFSLGAMAFRILTGRNVHEADSETELLVAMASKPAPPLRSVAPEVPASIAAVVDVALAFSKDARYPDAQTMQRDVRAIRAGQRPPHASEKAATRDMATRTDLVAPVSVVNPSERTTRPEATAATVQMPVSTRPVDVHRAATVPNPMYAAPTREANIHNMQTVERAALHRPTVPMTAIDPSTAAGPLAAGPESVHAAQPAAKRSGNRAGLAIVIAALFAAGAAAAWAIFGTTAKPSAPIVITGAPSEVLSPPIASLSAGSAIDGGPDVRRVRDAAPPPTLQRADPHVLGLGAVDAGLEAPADAQGASRRSSLVSSPSAPPAPEPSSAKARTVKPPSLAVPKRAARSDPETSSPPTATAPAGTAAPKKQRGKRPDKRRKPKQQPRKGRPPREQ